MALVIRQEFPLGRYHATPWRQSVFEDRRGEWPPSPWRLLRALAARWFQYSRETGLRDSAVIEALLQRLGGALPRFHVPGLGERGPAIRQYQPTAEFAWSDPKKGSGALKQAKTTLVPDQYQIACPEPVYWVWPDVDLAPAERALLEELLRRTLYFGRSESHCLMRIVEEAPAVNCAPCAAGEAQGRAPVLAADWQTPLRVDALLAETDSELLRDAPIPPGTVWVHYRVEVPRVRPVRRKAERSAMETHWVQFAMGGRVFPPAERWIKVTERFRGATLKAYGDAHGQEGPRYGLLSGKDPAHGTPLADHGHAYYFLWPDENGDPTRLVAWRRGVPFDADELAALAEAAERPIQWADAWSEEAKAGPWSLRLVSLPLGMAPPRALAARSTVWESVTPFVPPSQRHAFRRNGRVRAAERPEAICARLVEQLVGQVPAVEMVSEEPLWTRLHEPWAVRRTRKEDGGRQALARPGYFLRLRFAEPVAGPVLVGDSAHFGVGLFGAIAVPQEL